MYDAAHPLFVERRTCEDSDGGGTAFHCEAPFNIFLTGTNCHGTGCDANTCCGMCCLIHFLLVVVNNGYFPIDEDTPLMV